MTFRDHLRPALRNLSAYTVDTSPARIRLDANESPFEPPASVRREIALEAERLPLNRYPDPHARELKEALAAVWELDPERIILGNGSDELIGYLITAFTGRNGGVLYPVPTFSMYGIIARAMGQPAREVPLQRSEPCRRRTRSGRFSFRRCTVARPMLLRGRMMPLSSAKWALQGSTRGL